MSRAKTITVDLRVTLTRQEGTSGAPIDPENLIEELITEQLDGVEVWVDRESGEGDQVCFEVTAERLDSVLPPALLAAIIDNRVHPERAKPRPVRSKA